MIGRQDLALAYHSDDCPSRIACRGADLSLCGRPFDKIKAPAVIQQIGDDLACGRPEGRDGEHLPGSVR